MELYDHQKKALSLTEDKNRVAYYLDMGLGKTFVGAEKMVQLGSRVNLLICQKSKVSDWIDHFTDNYELSEHMMIYDCTKWKKEDWSTLQFNDDWHHADKYLLIINYELAWRRPELLKLQHYTLMLDESSLIQNETAKQSKFILRTRPDNVILLSGTPTSGKYENLWSQMRLLGWPISKEAFWNCFVQTKYIDICGGYKRKVVIGYKNVDRLKRKLAEYGCVFMKTAEVLDLPNQQDIQIKIRPTSNYRQFIKNSIVTIDDQELVGDTSLTKLLYARQLCGQFSDEKLAAFKDLVESTEDRLIVFYNFNAELDQLKHIAEEMDRPYGLVNGEQKDLVEYERSDNSILFVQYQAGAMGLNLQKANKIIYFTLPLSCELYEQSRKRIHRIGQDRPCFYYHLLCTGSVEYKILNTLKMRHDYNEKLFEKGE